ncbi:MAG: metal-dependent hydrolase [Synergistaceae bacterium]|nr:metal-dependent hydrolase [Synergistaceae bacterium]MBQ6435517.1 metal-dependent hydrolase [Synergistaceae bacterium]MBQ6738442.1 metal-dependent hydrolase [Synergistaceae bacterium]MBR0075832.1 metal-dependent hydrolase [Synergistaceae bacterium]MBR0079880.1 metal-dependent hydrolase [Synergistaceae bacterium]
MTGTGHRLSTFSIVLGTTSSPFAAILSLFGSTFPDSSEYIIFGKRRNRYHRRWTHWFIPWAFLAYICFQRSGWIVPKISTLIDGKNAHFDVWSCVGFWFTGCVLHILEDAWCGTVPFLRPWKRDIGFHVFHMSKKFGEMSRGEKNFVWCCILIGIIAFLVRTYTIEDFVRIITEFMKSI